MGKFTISTAIFNSYVSLPEGSICTIAPGNWEGLQTDLMAKLQILDGGMTQGNPTELNCQIG